MHKEVLSSLISDYEAYILILTDTLTTVNNWIKQTEEFISFIDENMLWIKTPFPTKEELKSEFQRLTQHLTKIYFPSSNYKTSLWTFLPISILIIIFSIALLLYYRYLGNKLIIMCPSFRTPLNFNFVNFTKFLLCFSLRTFLIPLGVLVIANLLKLVNSQFVIQIISTSLSVSAIPILFFLLL